MHLVQRRFARLQQQQALRQQGRRLAADLGADRPSRPGDEHHAAGHAGRQQRGVRCQGVASQQIVDIDFAHQADHVPATGDVGQRRQHAHAQGRALEFGNEVAAPQGGGGGSRHDDFVGLELLRQKAQALSRVDPQAVDLTPGE